MTPSHPQPTIKRISEEAPVFPCWLWSAMRLEWLFTTDPAEKYADWRERLWSYSHWCQWPNVPQIDPRNVPDSPPAPAPAPEGREGTRIDRTNIIRNAVLKWYVEDDPDYTMDHVCADIIAMIDKYTACSLTASQSRVAELEKERDEWKTSSQHWLAAYSRQESVIAEKESLKAQLSALQKEIERAKGEADLLRYAQGPLSMNDEAVIECYKERDQLHADLAALQRLFTSETVDNENEYRATEEAEDLFRDFCGRSRISCNVAANMPMQREAFMAGLMEACCAVTQPERRKPVPQKWHQSIAAPMGREEQK